MVVINGKTSTCNDLKEVKRRIYNQGIRGEKYRVDIVERRTGLITDVYIMYYTREGPIFQKQTYSKWKELEQDAERRQYNVFTKKK